MSKITRNVITKTLSLGSPETIVLPRNFCARNLQLKLAGSIDITNGTTAFTQFASGVANLLQNIRIRLDGRETVYSLGGLLTYELNKLLYGRSGAITNPAVTNASNVACLVQLSVPFENVLGQKEFDTLVNASKLQSSFDLVVDTNTARSAFNAGNGTVAVNTAFTLEVDVTEEVGVNNFVFGSIRTYLAQKVNVTGASNNFQIKPMPVGNYYKGIMIYAEDAGTGSDTLITNVKFKSGTDVFVDRPFAALQQEWAQKNRITTITTGFAYVDLMSDGSLNACLDLTDASGRRTAELELVVTAPSGTGNVYVVVLEYVPPTIVKQA